MRVETSNPPSRWQGEAVKINKWFDAQRREIPQELRDTVWAILLSGIEVVANEQGAPMLIIRSEIAPVFRKYHDLLLHERFSNYQLRKYRDGRYAVSITGSALDFMWSLEKNLAQTKADSA